MRALMVSLVVLAGSPPVPAADVPTPVGAIRSDQGGIELLPAPQAEIRTPEGFLRLEGGAPEDAGARGSFGTYQAAAGEAPSPVRGAAAAARGAATSGLSPPPPPTAEGFPPASGPPPALADPCRAERDRYLRVLLRMAAIDVERPLDLVDGLAGPGGSPGSLLFTRYGVLATLDPIHPLAWDPDLRAAARDLAACQGAP